MLVKESIIQPLLKEFEESQKAYDQGLMNAFAQSMIVEGPTGPKTKQMTEERAKVLARDAVRKAGLRQPETIRYELAMYVGVIKDAE